MPSMTLFSLDIWMPDRDGLEAARDEIRYWLDRANIKPEVVVIISGHGTIEAAVRATKLGAYDFLEKPLSLDRTLHRHQERHARPPDVGGQPGVRPPTRLKRHRHRPVRPHEGASPAD